MIRFATINVIRDSCPVLDPRLLLAMTPNFHGELSSQVLSSLRAFDIHVFAIDIVRF